MSLIEKLEHSKLNNLSTSVIKNLVRYFNLHNTIKLNQKKEQLINDLKRKVNLYIDNDNNLYMELKDNERYNTNIKYNRMSRGRKTKPKIIMDEPEYFSMEPEPEGLSSYLPEPDTTGMRPFTMEDYKSLSKVDEKRNSILKATIPELKKMARQLGLRGYSKDKKADLQSKVLNRYDDLYDFDTFNLDL